MSKDGKFIIDSDFHVMEPWDLWMRYLPERWRGQAPVGSRLPRDISLVPDLGFPDPARRSWASLPYKIGWSDALASHMAPAFGDYEFALEGDWSPEVHLEAMDREGIDVGVMFPSRGLFVMGFDVGTGPGRLEAEFASVIARAYNDWLDEFIEADRTRMYGADDVPHDVDAAVRETRRCVEQLGFRTVFLLPGIVGGREWHHPDYDPLWRTCEELDIPVSFHGGGIDHLTDFGVGHEQHLMMWHTFSHCLGPMSALVSFCAGGVLDRFPSLRAAFLQGNCSWAPWLLHRLDEQYDEYVGRHEVKLSRLPSEAFVANCYVAVEADEKTAPLYVQTFGDDNVVFSTDFPHPDV